MLVTPFLSGAPSPEKNPGSAPVEGGAQKQNAQIFEHNVSNPTWETLDNVLSCAQADDTRFSAHRDVKKTNQLI